MQQCLMYVSDVSEHGQPVSCSARQPIALSGNNARPAANNPFALEKRKHTGKFSLLFSEIHLSVF